MPAVQQNSPAKARPAVARAAQRHAQAESDYLRGLVLAKSERWSDAAAAFGAATDRNPDDAVFWLNLAHARIKLGALDGAADAARQAVRIDPRSELGVTIATQCLAAGSRHEETVEMLCGLDLERVTDPAPHIALGDAYAGLQRFRDAVAAYLRALQLKPDYFPGHVRLSNAFERLGMFLEARECLQTAIALGGPQLGLRSAMAYHAQHACRWDLFAQDFCGLEQEQATGVVEPVPFHLLTMPSTRSAQRAAGYAYWAERCSGIVPMPAAGPRIAGARIKVGYVTNDLYRHATAYLIADLIEIHDRSRVEVFVYSYGHDDGSQIRMRIVAAAGSGFVDASRMSDEQLAERIRSDDIDIVLDLKGYTMGTRLPVFALHPGRVQVNYLGYPGTMGAPGYEYIIGDRVVTPLEHEADYSEKIAQMPRCYQPNDRRRTMAPRATRAQWGLPERAFVFCSFNNCYKITAPVFDRWCRLLQQVEGSILWLYEANAQARPNLLRAAQQRGIAADRIFWAPAVDQPEHLARLQLADLVLDTLPVNAHTTASDALWAGVPIVTTPGQSFVSRVASSVLLAADLPELIAADGDQYEALALALAQNPERLRKVRAQLARNRDDCALFDSQAYTRDLEGLFARMLETWTRGAAPAHLPACPRS